MLAENVKVGVGEVFYMPECNNLYRVKECTHGEKIPLIECEVWSLVKSSEQKRVVPFTYEEFYRRMVGPVVSLDVNTFPPDGTVTPMHVYNVHLWQQKF